MDERKAPLCLSRWDLLGGGGLTGVFLAWVLVVDRLPLRVPTHFNWAGEADGWTDRGALPWLIFLLPVGTWLLSWLMDLAFQGSDASARVKTIANRPLRGLMTLGVSGLSVAMLLIPLLGFWILWAALGFLLLSPLLLILLLR